MTEMKAGNMCCVFYKFNNSQGQYFSIIQKVDKDNLYVKNMDALVESEEYEIKGKLVAYKKKDFTLKSAGGADAWQKMESYKK